MLGTLKLALTPFSASAMLISALPSISTVGTVAAIAGVAALIGGVAVVARYKAIADVSERERKIYQERDVRLTRDNHELASRIGELEALPNLETHQATLVAIGTEMRSMNDELREHSRHSEVEFQRRAAHDEQLNLVLGSIADKLTA